MEAAGKSDFSSCNSWFNLVIISFVFCSAHQILQDAALATNNNTDAAAVSPEKVEQVQQQT